MEMAPKENLWLVGHDVCYPILFTFQHKIQKKVRHNENYWKSTTKMIQTLHHDEKLKLSRDNTRQLENNHTVSIPLVLKMLVLLCFFLGFVGAFFGEEEMIENLKKKKNWCKS